MFQILKVSFTVDRTSDVFPKITRPSIISYFSINKNRLITQDLSQLKYLSHPKDGKVHFDLTKGYKDVIRKCKGAEDEKLEHILTWLFHNIDIVKSTDHGKWYTH